MHCDARGIPETLNWQRMLVLDPLGPTCEEGLVEAFVELETGCCNVGQALRLS